MPRKLHLLQTDAHCTPIGSNPINNSKEEIMKDYESFQQNVYIFTDKRKLGLFLPMFDMNVKLSWLVYSTYKYVECVSLK